VDPERNRNVRGNIAEIQPVGAKDVSPVLIIKTNEEKEIARQTLRVIEKAGR
jgi:acetate kinase